MLTTQLSLALVTVTVAIACAASGSGPCGDFGHTGEWHLVASAPRESLDARLQFGGSEPRLVGTMFMAEGWGEPLDYPIDSLSIRRDSIRFQFAPAAILVEGRCTSPTRIRARFGEAGAIPGAGWIERTR